MENFTYKPDKNHMDRIEFQEDGNDSDLEGRLYAEIYYSNAVRDPGESFEDGIKTIQDIKNASQASDQKSPKPIQNNLLELENANNPSNSAKKSGSPRNYQTDQTALVNAEKDKVLSYVDKNPNLQKQLNLETQSNNSSGEDSNKIVHEIMNPQEKPGRNLTPKQKSPRQKMNETPEIMNKEIENSFTPNSTIAEKSVNKKKKKVDESPQVLNNSLATPKSRKRTSEMDKVTGAKNKRSLEPDKIFLSNTPKSTKGEADVITLTPISLNAKKWSDESTSSLIISPETLAFLFPPESKEDRRKEDKNKKVGSQSKMKAAKLKTTEVKNSKIPAEITLTPNSKQSNKTLKSTEKDEIIEIISSDSSEYSSEEYHPILETPKVERQNQREKSKNEMPKWLELCSDSEESILEVPVPPKPLPPVIDLNDSRSDSSDSDDSSNDGIYVVNSKFQTNSMKRDVTFSNSNSTSDLDSGFEKKSEVSSKVPKEIPKVISINHSTENPLESFEQNLRSQFSSEHSSHTDTSDSSYVDFQVDERMDSIGENLILNCTSVEKCANSLEEIQKMRKDDISEEINGTENATEYNEYIEPLNDLAEPSTSSASGSFAQKKSKKKSEQNHKTSKEKTDEEYFFEPMSIKIKAFYNNSWGGEEFSVENAQKQMRKDRRFWEILDEDWKPALLKQQRYFLSKIKCTRCRQSGHLRADCPERKKGPVCHMCGSQGHYETRCPDKLCLTCGSKQNSFRQTCESCRKLFCKLCNSRGHKEDFCPDLWRQFHHTDKTRRIVEKKQNLCMTSETEHNPPKNASSIMKPSRHLYCCNCTMQGHESSTCNKYRWTQHYPTPSQVTSYYKCNLLMPHTNFSNKVDVANLTESPGESSQNAIIDVEPGNISNEEISQVSENDISTARILFQINMARSQRNAEKFRNKKDRIVLSDVEGANLEGLIAGTIVPKALSQLSHVMQCGICVTLFQDNKVVMNVTYYIHFTKKDLFRKFITLWIKLSDEDKQRVKYLSFARVQKDLISILDRAFKRLDKMSGNINILFEEIKTLTHKLKTKKNCKVKEPKKTKLINRCTQERRNKILLLVRLLYKNDWATEKHAVSNLRKLREDLKEMGSVSLDVHFSIIYYYCLIFGSQIPPNFEEMVQNYMVLNKDSRNRSISNSVSSENSEVDFKTRNSDNIEDRGYHHQEHSNPQPAYQNYVDEEPVCRSYHQNRPSTSIPSIFEVNPHNFPPQFYQEQSTSSPGCSNPEPRKNPQPNQFKFPVADFIPISNYRPSEFLHMDSQVDQSRNFKQFRRNPMHNFETFDSRDPQTNRGLNNEALYLMNKAMQLNLPKLKRAVIRLKELINQNRLQRKHINNLRRLINLQNKKRSR